MDEQIEKNKEKGAEDYIILPGKMNLRTGLPSAGIPVPKSKSQKIGIYIGLVISTVLVLVILYLLYFQ